MRPRGLAAIRSLGGGAGRARRWTTSLPLGRRAAAGSIVLAALVAATFGVLFVAISHLRSSTDVQARSRDVTGATLGVESLVDELETSLRAFVVSGNDRFLVSFRRARTELPPAYAKVTRLLAGQPAESWQATQLSQLTSAYISEYGVPLIAIARVSAAAARAPVATREGVFRIDAIRSRLDRLLTSESALASADEASANSQAGAAVHAGIVALVGAAVLLAAFGVFLVRGIVEPARAVAAGASRVAAGDLSTRLPEQGAAEIHALTRAFNVMARSLERGKRELEIQNEELRQSERLKSQLVSIVSHELRTPLTSILGYARLLRSRTFEPAQVDRYLAVILQQGERLTSLIDQFLDGESVDTGRIELADRPFDLRPVLVHETRLAADKTAAHRVALADGGPLPVRGDRDRVAQVVANLLDNAVKYSPDGGLVEVAGEITGEVVRVHVSDQGMGVPEEHRARIFTKFFRGNAPDSGIAGTGLGLAVSREIVEAHGGLMGFTSRYGEGADFWFELPLAAEPASSDAALASGAPGRGRQPAGRR